MRHRNAIFANTKRRVKKLRYFFETALIESAAWIMPRLPRGFILALSRGIGTLAYWGDKRGRTTALENLRCAFGDEYTPQQRQRIARKSYQVFARTFLDLFWSSRLTKDTWQQFFTIHLADPAAEKQAHETGGVWVTPHFGNFELVSMVWGFRGFKFTVVAQDFKNPTITHVFTRLRSHSGHEIISQENAMLKLMKALKRQGHAGLLTDLNIPPGKAASAIQCFGLWTCVPNLHVELAKRLGLSIMTGVCRPLDDGRYEVHFYESIKPGPTEDTQQLTQRVWNHFEKAIRQHPECWLWMYKHWRFRPKNLVAEQNASYPSYSYASQRFTTLLPVKESSS
jgi:lauroyl/myristoyl acyltransferase